MKHTQEISEEYKAGVHLALFGLAVAAGLYNLSEAWRKQDRHHKANVVAYVGFAVYEVVQIWRHLKASQRDQKSPPESPDCPSTP